MGLLRQLCDKTKKRSESGNSLYVPNGGNSETGKQIRATSAVSPVNAGANASAAYLNKGRSKGDWDKPGDSEEDAAANAGCPCDKLYSVNEVLPPGWYLQCYEQRVHSSPSGW